MLIGDIILCEKEEGPLSILIWLGNLWSAFFVPSKSNQYIHVAVASGDLTIIEANPNGVHEYDFYYKKYAICRLKSMTSAQREKVYEYIRTAVGRPYSFWLILVIGVLKLFRAERLINGTRYEGFICSVLAAKAYARIGYNFKPGENIDMIDPKDIADCILYNDKESWDIISAK